MGSDNSQSTDGSTWRDEQVNGKQPQIVGGQAEMTNFPSELRGLSLFGYLPNKHRSTQAKQHA